MEVRNIQHMSAYIAQENPYHAKNMPAKDDVVAKKNVDTRRIVAVKKEPEEKKGVADKEKQEDSQSPSSNDSSASYPVSTRVSLSVERDLNLVVTRVVDTKTKKVVRQIPPEEAIKKMRLLKSYRQPSPSLTKGLILDDIVE